MKSYEDILATLDTNNKNRGMSFDAELVPYCGKIHRVRGRVEKFIDEKTGYIKTMKTPAVILEGAYCRARYSDHRMFCPRSIYSWWREVWLERVSEIALPANDGQPCPLEELKARLAETPMPATASADRRAADGAGERPRRSGRQRRRPADRRSFASAYETSGSHSF